MLGPRKHTNLARQIRKVIADNPGCQCDEISRITSIPINDVVHRLCYMRRANWVETAGCEADGYAHWWLRGILPLNKVCPLDNSKNREQLRPRIPLATKDLSEALNSLDQAMQRIERRSAARMRTEIPEYEETMA